jgi:predicted RNase H-like HicB family nuclease
MRYLVVIERAGANFSAYVPDLPGCIATSETRDEVHQAIREAVAFHLQGLKADGLSPGEPQAAVDYVET